MERDYYSEESCGFGSALMPNSAKRSTLFVRKNSVFTLSSMVRHSIFQLIVLSQHGLLLLLSATSFPAAAAASVSRKAPITPTVCCLPSNKQLADENSGRFNSPRAESLIQGLVETKTEQKKSQYWTSKCPNECYCCSESVGCVTVC